MGEMAALAQCREIARVIVTRVLIKVRCSQHDKSASPGGRRKPGQQQLIAYQQGRGGHTPEPSSARVAPVPEALIPPAPIVTNYDALAMRTTALLAVSAGTLKTYALRQLAPVDRVVPALAWADRHDDSMNHLTAEQNK